MSEANDPRVYFAAERTLLAWVRTGLATAGLGFVVARFGLFLRVLRGEAETTAHLGSTLIGVGLVLLGGAAIGLAARQHQAFCRGLPDNARPRSYFVGWPVWFAAMIAVTCAVLAIYLLARADGA